jgi:UDP-N-acetylglucosamine 2-epimerase
LQSSRYPECVESVKSHPGAAGTALLTGTNAQAIVKHATQLLTDGAAYRAMATANNPYGDGYAAARIVERIRCYFREVGADREAA